MKGFDIRVLECFASPDQKSFLIDYLTRPDFVPWGELDAACFETTFGMLKRQLAADRHLDRLLSLYLITHLLDNAAAPIWALPFARRNIDLDTLFPSISWDTLTSGQWTMFPAAMVKGDRTHLQYFMAGLLKGSPDHDLLPPWARQMMDEAALQAFLDAAEAALSRHPNPPDSFPYVFPLALPLPQNHERLQGPSLGLPAALAFMKLLSGRNIPNRQLATGSIQKDGRVGKVDGLTRKLELAKKDGRFSLFIYPEESESMPGETELTLFPVTDLDEAWRAVFRHAPGNGGELLAFARMMKDPAAFVAGMERVDPAWVQYEVHRGRCTDVIRKIAANPALFAGYVERIDRKLQVWALDAATMYLDLVPSEDLALAGRHSPLSAFRLHTQRIALSNHRGDVTAARNWAEKAQKLYRPALRGSLDLCADFINNRFVTRHNQYQFDPLFPEDLSRLLDTLECRHEAACRGGCPTDPVLARLWGTIAQNFAFCGPDFLDASTSYARKAMAAFGGGAVPEFRPESLRQQNYLTYAFLDAGEYSRAEACLMAFTEARDWRDIMEKCRAGRLNLWHHAALARFFADTDEDGASLEYLRWCAGNNPFFKNNDHPGQLWACNMGRIATRHRMPDAPRWFRQSLDLCLAKKNRPTIHVMALLPLSELRHLRAVDESGLAETLSEVIPSAVKLNADHFRPLQNADPETSLENIRQHPRRLFPFTYR